MTAGCGIIHMTTKHIHIYSTSETFIQIRITLRWTKKIYKEYRISTVSKYKSTPYYYGFVKTKSNKATLLQNMNSRVMKHRRRSNYVSRCTLYAFIRHSVRLKQTTTSAMPKIICSKADTRCNVSVRRKAYLHIWSVM
jgi:hypothetical protein